MLMKAVSESDADKQLDLMSLVQVLHNHLEFDAVQTRIASLRWLHHLYKEMPDKVFPYLAELFQNLLKLLSDSYDDVSRILSNFCI